MNNKQAQQFETITMDREYEVPAVYDRLPHYLERAAVERSNVFAKLLGQANSLVTRAYRKWRQWHSERQALKELEALDDVLLKDIGINRGQLQRLRYAATTTHELQSERKDGAKFRNSINRHSNKVVALKQRDAGRLESHSSVLLKKCS